MPHVLLWHTLKWVKYASNMYPGSGITLWVTSEMETSINISMNFIGQTILPSLSANQTKELWQIRHGLVPACLTHFLLHFLPQGRSWVSILGRWNKIQNLGKNAIQLRFAPLKIRNFYLNLRLQGSHGKQTILVFHQKPQFSFLTYSDTEFTVCMKFNSLCQSVILW